MTVIVQPSVPAATVILTTAARATLALREAAREEGGGGGGGGRGARRPSRTLSHTHTRCVKHHSRTGGGDVVCRREEGGGEGEGEGEWGVVR